jgi:hypothetical protein
MELKLSGGLVSFPSWGGYYFYDIICMEHAFLVHADPETLILLLFNPQLSPVYIIAPALPFLRHAWPVC